MRNGWGLAVLLGGSGLLIAATVVGRWSSDPKDPLLMLDVAAGVVAWVLTPLLVWRPVGATAALTVLAVLSPAVTPSATMGVLQVARRRDRTAAIAVSVGGIAAHAVQGAWRVNTGMSYGWWLALVTIAYGALLGWGLWARAREALIRTLRERAQRAEAEQGRRVAEARMLERRRIAREMHDVLAHRLSLLATFAGAMEFRPDAPPEQMSRAAGVVRSGVHQALEELREVIGLLREDDGGDGVHPQPVLADVPRLVAESRAAGTEVLLRESVDDPAEAPPTVARTAYRVVQEGLTNARKHAAGQTVRVTVSGGPGADLVVDVRNPLAGPDTPRPGKAGPDKPRSTEASPDTPPAEEADRGMPASGGAGLVGLTERVHLAGGRLDHQVTDGEFRLYASIPWPA
ncbi:histidine kinase [Actinoplanes sp. CA-252034]|uniref:histidine kinase n=1 Tax=Actinoplanes sp. CA-252034 TaxID=3239906 RepID=UPI003D968541